MYEIRNFYICFSASESKKKEEINEEINTLENSTKTFEENLTNNKSNQDYLKNKCNWNYIYDQKLLLSLSLLCFIIYILYTIKYIIILYFIITS